MKNADLMEIEKYNIDLKNYNIIGKQKKESSTQVNIIQDKNSSKKYVAKTFPITIESQNQQLFLSEIFNLIQIRHPTLVQFKGFSYKDFQDSNNVTILINYMENGSLLKLFEGKMKNINSIEFNTKRQILLVGIAYGMMILQDRNIIYHDLKPGNVLLDDNYQPLLTDFFLSKFKPQTFSLEQHSNINSIAYLAPEIIITNIFNSKSDVYSFGILMYEILTGERAYKKDFESINFSKITFLKKVIEGYRPKFNVSIQKSFENLIEKCWSNDPQKRPTFSEIFTKLSLIGDNKINNDDSPILNKNYCLNGVNIDELFFYVNEITSNSALKIVKKKEKEKLYHTDEICQQIFSLDRSNVSIPQNLDEKSKEFVNLILKSFPKDSEIRSFLKDIKNESIKNFVFPLDDCNDNLKTIFNGKDLFKYQSIFDIFSIYSFYSWISIYTNLKQKFDISNLLKVLNYIIKITSNNNEKTKYHYIAVSCFVEIIKKAIENDSLDNTFSEISDFFVKNKDLPENSDEIIKLLLAKIVTPNNELSSEGTEFINLISFILNQNPKSLSNQLILSIIKSIKTSIINLNITSLNFFLNAANHIEMENFVEIFKPLLVQLLTNTVIDHNINEELNQEKDENSTQLFQLKIDDFDYFNPPKNLYQIDDIDNTKIITDFKVKDLKSFLNQQIFGIVLLIGKIILLNENYAQFFLSEAEFNLQSLHSSLKDHLLLKRIFYEQCTIVFYLVSSVIKKYSNLTINKLHKYIFDPKITYFTQNSNFDIINSLRDFIFRFLIDYFPISLSEILKEISIFPEIFLESICRILLIKKNSSINFKLTFSADTLITSLCKYRINSSFNKNDENVLILKIRKFLLTYFNEFLLNNSIIEIVFSSPTFVECFFSLLIEPPIRNSFISYLQKYLLSITSDSFISENMDKIVNKTCVELPQEEAYSLLLSILNSFNESLSKNKSLSNVFIPVASNICLNIKKLQFITVENKDELFYSLIDFLIGSYCNETIKENHLILLESTFNYFIETIFQTKIMEKIIQIIAGEQLQSISPTFEVKNSKFLCSLVRVFLKTNLVYKVFQFISDLCNYSSSNCIKCHEAELDSLIIEIIDKWRKNIIQITTTDYNDLNNDHIYISERLINVILHLFVQISTTISSIPVINKFFSLLCPIENQYLSLMHGSILNTLNSIFIKSKFSPICVIPMGKDNEIQIKEISSNFFDQGLCFIFWILIPSKIEGYSQNVLVLNDGKEHMLKIKMIGNSLRVVIQSGTVFYSSDFELNIPTNSWKMISISSNPNSNNQGTSITLYINKEKIQDLITFASFSPKAQVECIINQSKQNPNDFDPPLMGTFILAKQLLKEEIESIYDEGQRSSLSLFSEKIIFAYSEKICENSLSLIPIQKLDKKISESIPKSIQFKTDDSFSDLLINNSKVDLIIPIFAQFDIPLKNGHKLTKDFSIEILMNLFNLSEKAQSSFYQFNGFFAIAYLLQNSDKAHVNYELYIQYSKLLENITFKNLQLQLIDAILMNINLWSKDETKNQAKIFKHWLQNIYNSHKSMVDNVRQIEWFILIIHRFYNNEDPNSFSCRKSLFEIAIEISKTNISLKNLFLIIEIICSVKSSIIERKGMLNFLSKIIQNKQTIIESKINISPIIPRLFQIFNLQEKDDDLIIQTISFYIIIYKHKEYNPKTPLFSLIQKIIISLNINQSYIFKEEMFSILISLMNVNKATELLPIISVNAILGGANYLILMIKNIDRKLNYYITKQSIIYPALLLFAYFPNTYLYHEVVRMNISLFKHHWTILVNSINILGYFYFDHNVFDKIKHDILYRLIIQPKIMRIDALAMIRVIKDFIFFRPEKAESSVLAKMINQNIFKDDEISYKSNSESKNSIEEDVDENSDGSEIDISNSSNNNDTINYISNSLPKPNAFGYNQMKISTLPNSFRVRFDLNAVGPVLNTKNASESTLSDDGGFNFEFKDFDEFECDTKIIDIIRNLKEKIENVIKSNPFDASVIFKYKFGMRFSQEDEKWLDLDLAKSTFLLYKSYKDIQYAETMNLLAHFVYKCDHFFINKMKAFFQDLNIYLGEIRKISLYDQMELQLNYHDEMINHQNLLFSNAFVSFYNSTLNDQSFSIKTDQNKLFELIYNFENQLEKVNRINKNIWSSLWHSLTIIRAPWSDSISIEKGYKRMNKFCFAFCPYKIQINEHFDKHTKASLMRDLKGTKNSFLISSNNQKERSQNPLFNYEFENLKTSDFVITKSDNKDTLECKLVTIKWEKNALIKFDTKMIIITIVFENKTILIPYSDIHSIMYAYKHQKYSGIQILTKSREEYFVIFQNNFFRSLILRIRYMPQMDINKVQNENPKSFLNSFKITNFWVEGKITNFEYLIFLNILSGRSFNDATQYPIFPWIISDYKSDKLDLNSPSVFRDLSKPIGALNEGRLNELIERMNKMKENNSYLYENCYSNLFIVFYYLIRLEPFTTQLIEINDGKFDDCSLIFKSIEESFENAIKNCSELVPEFFFMPEFLINMNNFDLGKTIDKVTVNDVILPPWSNNSPIEFVYLNRKALESDFVSRNLNKWIDLIWGFKQDGEEAVKANNVFRPEIYETIWKRSDVNEKGIKAVQNNAGQIPLKLFDVKHPERKNQLKKSLLKKSSIFTFSDQNDRQKYSVIKLFEVNRIVSANVSLHSHKNKFYFTVLDNKGKIFVYSVKFKKLNATEIIIKAKKSQNISIDQENRPTICFPKFIDSNFLCFYDKQSSSVKLFDCKSFSLFENIKQNFEVVSIETNQEGFFAISTKDSNMTVYNVHNSIQNSKQSKIQMNSNELKSQFEQDCFFGSPAKISSFKESIICIAIHPTFDALICGTKDNCLLFCQLNKNQMKVIKMIKINGKPQKIIITDVFGFVAVLIKKIKNGEIFEKVILFTINGEKIKTLKIEKDQQIVSMEKAKSMPSGLDFLIMADNNNRIYVFEAFYMKLNEPIFICNSKVLKLTYIKEESLIIAFCEDGTVTIIFYPIIY